MQSSSPGLPRLVLAGLVALTAICGLLLPSFLNALVWTVLNLMVMSVATALMIATALWTWRFQWACATATSLLNAYPPYSNWVNFDGSGEFAIAVRAFSLADKGNNFLVFAWSMAWCFVLFWAIGRIYPPRKVPE